MSNKFGTRKITANQMVELERIFNDDEDADGLDMDQFVEVFQTVMGGKKEDDKKPNDTIVDQDQDANSKRYLTHLFMKIDANSDGTVDWEEFLNFLLLENQGLENSNFDQQRDTLVRDTMQCDNYHSNHSNMISTILHFPNQSRYISGSLDGTIKLWDTCSFQIKKTIINSPNKSWVMDLVHLPLSNQIAAISMDGIVNIYSENGWKLNSQFMNKPYVLSDNKHGDTVKKFNRDEQRWLITSTPVCGDGAILNGSGNNNAELLSIGTESGKAFLYTLNSEKYHICCGDQSLAPNQISMKRNQNEGDKNENIVSPILTCSHIQPFRIGITPHIMDIHNDWITKIKYNLDLQSLITCSLDSQIRFSDIERRKKTRIYMGHNRGVHSFSYNREYKFMASCGVERKIHIFDANRCARLQLLVGHNTSISHILQNESVPNQLISLSFDKVIKIWDTRTFRCLQTLHDDNNSYQPDNRISSLLFDHENKRLITCSSRLQSWSIRFDQSRKSQSKSHDDGVSAAYFNKHFLQCVSSDFSGNIHVWDITDSSRVFRYCINEKITSLAFDTSQRRVITGSDIGTLKMWNFSSGQCLCEFRDYEFISAHWKMDNIGKNKNNNNIKKGTEITGIVYVMEVISWNEKDVKHWFESFRDKELRDIGNKLIQNGLKNGNELLELTHDILLNKYKINTVIFRRKILNSISNLYQSNIASRYIVSIGWDNKLRVWIDSTNKPIQYPITVMPSELNIKQSNQNGILCITHFPPVYVITGGNDGSIVIWNVVSGVFKKKQNYPIKLLSNNHHHDDNACISVSYININEYKLIITAHSNGSIIFWDPNQNYNPIGYRHTSHTRFGGINYMVTNNKIIITTDNSSMLQIFDISQFWNKLNIKNICNTQNIINFKKYVKRLNIWCTQHNNITCIDYLNNKNLILTCGDNGEIILWNNNGVKIGMFGQMCHINNNKQFKKKTKNHSIPKLWNLNDKNTFIDAQSSRSEMNNILDTPTIIKKNQNNNNNNNNKTHMIKQHIFDSTTDNNNENNNLNNIKISDNTLKLINNNNNNNINKNNNKNQLLLSSPELHAILQKPSACSKGKKKTNILHDVLNKKLQTFNLDNIPKETPFCNK